MLEIKKGKLGQIINSTDLYDYLELDRSQYSRWIKKHIQNNIYSEEGKDYLTLMSNEIKRGKFRKDYEIHVDFALKLCMVSHSPIGEAVRNQLIDLINQKKDNDLLTHDQVIYLSKLKAVFSFISECKKAEQINLDNHVKNSNSKSPFAEFHKMRNDILKLDSKVIDERLKQYCIDNQRLLPKSKSKVEKLIVIDKYEVLRNGVWDFLTACNEEQSLKLANLVKKMAEAENLAIKRVNDFDLLNSKIELPKIK
jgi:phage anti-repressor protein